MGTREGREAAQRVRVAPALPRRWVGQGLISCRVGTEIQGEGGEGRALEVSAAAHA